MGVAETNSSSSSSSKHDAKRKRSTEGKNKDQSSKKKAEDSATKRAKSIEEADAVSAEQVRVTSAKEEFEKDMQISFKHSEDIEQALDTRNSDLLIQGFTHLREHLKICNQWGGNRSAEEGAEQRAHREQCQRVVYHWAENSEGFQAIESAWQQAHTNSIARLDGLIPGVVGGLLVCLDNAGTMKFGNRLIRMVLDKFLKSLYRSLNTARSTACASALQLLYQMVVFARGEHADEVRHAFDWTMKSLEELPHVRSSVVGFSIRRLWIRFVMAFFSVDRCRTYNELFRSGRLVGGLFHGVERDSYQELHTLLATVYENIVLNDGIGKAEKVRLFGVQLMGNLAKAAKNTVVVDAKAVGVEAVAQFVPGSARRDESVAAAGRDSVAALVLRFFRGMMTFPGHGICFPQHGLYPAPRQQQQLWASNESNDDGDALEAVVTVTKRATSAEISDLCNSQILRILIACISPAASRRMGDLAVDIMRVSPELIAPFWRNYGASLEPRLSLRYLGNTAFATKVMSLELPLPPQDSGDARFGLPPRVSTLAEHVWPLALQRQMVGRGLQFRASPLVRYRCLLLADVALRKLGDARAWIRSEAARAGATAPWARGGRSWSSGCWPWSSSACPSGSSWWPCSAKPWARRAGRPRGRVPARRAGQRADARHERVPAALWRARPGVQL
ncbi:ribosome 60S biogenesis N-terminal-domain-containing protein [Kickxella alabastrina]|uniref:ribosome 60S biogenesis N-terminal-domain-containing protein n=1 Tax=Kickxella alabastrina TaxID=61397 RepID=UPI00221E9678|nr:ribosome 60S biogenesis N-terminal-domain-containing protein [Kickxella alabastrina]KAI7833733.1 ribosome 60S biogenesis N-terminal-domain-containing protein [Kickxella alabastrina]